MSSEEDEAVCLTNNNRLELSIDHCLLTLCVILIYDLLRQELYFIEFGNRATFWPLQLCNVILGSKFSRSNFVTFMFSSKFVTV
jgi:hypothetical protein